MNLDISARPFKLLPQITSHLLFLSVVTMSRELSVSMYKPRVPHFLISTCWYQVVYSSLRAGWLKIGLGDEEVTLSPRPTQLLAIT